MNHTYKTFTSNKSEANESERSLVHYVSTITVDRDNEVILPSKIDNVNFTKNPIVLFNHWSSSSTLTVIGKSLWQKADEFGYLVKTKFAKTNLADDVYNLYKDGFLTSWSIGFVSKESPKEIDGVRTYGEIELLEYSAVTIPANPDAVTLSFIKDLKSDELRSVYTNEVLMKEFEIMKTDFTDLKTSLEQAQKSLLEIAGELQADKLKYELKAMVTGAINKSLGRV